MSIVHLSDSSSQAAEDANNRAVCLGGFVQDDRFETQLANTDNITFFHWIDAPPSTVANPSGLIARF